MTTVYIGLGSNLGDRAQNLHAARSAMPAHGIAVTRISSLYETAPRDFLDQPWFMNQVIEAETPLGPLPLLHALLAIEREMGRERIFDKGPRLIDLDLLLHGDETVRTGEVEIPHPRLFERRFVLEPLAELVPHLLIRCPDKKNERTAGEWLALVLDQQVKRSG